MPSVLDFCSFVSFLASVCFEFPIFLIFFFVFLDIIFYEFSRFLTTAFLIMVFFIGGGVSSAADFKPLVAAWILR